MNEAVNVFFIDDPKITKLSGEEKKRENESARAREIENEKKAMKNAVSIEWKRINENLVKFKVRPIKSLKYLSLSLSLILHIKQPTANTFQCDPFCKLTFR